jgi:hypothetical protein
LRLLTEGNSTLWADLFTPVAGPIPEMKAGLCINEGTTGRTTGSREIDGLSSFQTKVDITSHLNRTGFETFTAVVAPFLIDMAWLPYNLDTEVAD